MNERRKVRQTESKTDRKKERKKDEREKEERLSEKSRKIDRQKWVNWFER